jgi:hypothetical protein
MNPITKKLDSLAQGAESIWPMKFGEWWFLAGGSIHGLWRRKNYSAIRDAAMDLPRQGFRKGYEARDIEVSTLIAALKVASEALASYSDSGKVNHAGQALAEILRLLNGGE